MKLWMWVAVYYLLLGTFLAAITALTLYAGLHYPRTLPERDERQKIAAASGEPTEKMGGTEEAQTAAAVASPKTGGREPWYG